MKDVAPGAVASYKDQSFSAQPGQEMAAADYASAQSEKEQKFQDFFKKYWQAGKEDQTEMSKQLDEVFSDYLGSGTSAQESGN